MDLLNLSKDASEYECHITKYAAGHESLTIQVTSIDHEELFYVLFTGVKYYSGNTRWRGAILKIDNSKNHATILKRSMGKYQELIEADASLLESLIQGSTLYNFVGLKSTTIILASSIEINDNL